MRQDSCFDSCASHRARANLQFCAGADCQNLVDHDLLANVRSNLFYFNFFASSNLILFATGFCDRVHVRPFNQSLPTLRQATQLSQVKWLSFHCSTLWRFRQFLTGLGRALPQPKKRTTSSRLASASVKPR